MNTYERFKRMYEHRDADRVPIIDGPWEGTLRRWRAEGMPENVAWEEFFDIDRVVYVSADISPRFERRIIEENDRWYIETSEWGVTMKRFKQEDSTPEMLDFRVKDAKAWLEAKERMTLEDDRIPWDWLKREYEGWRAKGYWLSAYFWFGFDVTHSWMMGTENLLIAMMEEPELVTDMFNTYLSRCEEFHKRIWDAGYRFDEVHWPDDMGYKGTTFFSPDTYRRLLKPFHARAAAFAHERGMYARLHSCGNVMTFVDEIIDAGIDALNPLEVKAGMDSLELKRKYGDRLVLNGGINALYWNEPDRIIEEINQKLPILKQNGGYIFSSDHSIPNDVSLDSMKRIVAAAKKAGSY